MPCNELACAHERWPQFVEHAEAATLTRDHELANRELSDAGVSRITMVPLTVATLTEFADRTGADPTDETTRYACMLEIIDARTFLYHHE